MHRLFLFLLLFPAALLSPAASASETAVLEPVIVYAPRIPSAIEQVPAAVSVVEMEEFRSGKLLVTLDDALTRAPGVMVRNRFNFAQDLRISIRGFGARSAFGIRGIQILVDGIPYTLPDGQSQVDGIDPEAVERIEVLRGPIAALYGNSSGGVLHFKTFDGPERPFVEAEAVAGEFGLLKSVLKGGGESGRANYFLNVSRLEIDGFREHGEAESWKMLGKLRYDLDDSSDLTFLVNLVHSPELKDPGGLTRAQAREDPRQAAPLSLRFDTGEEISEERLGVVYRRALPRDRNLEASAYLSLRQLDNAIPFRFVELDREFFGGGIRYDTPLEILGVDQRLFAGAELQYQADDRRNFDNAGGSPGDTLLLDQDEEVTDLGLYLQDEVRLTEKWSVMAGGRYDAVRFDIDDHLEQDGDDSGSRTFDQATGRVGVNYLLRPWTQFYANITQSFETPTATELVNRPEGGGGINPGIEPQKATNYEIGLKGVPSRSFTCGLALFYIDLEDELIAFRDATDRVFYRNAGKSRRKGAELEATAEIAEGLRAHLAYTWLDAEFVTFEKDGSDLKGNRVPGLPEHQLFGEILYEHRSGLYAAVDALYADESFVDDENTVESGSFTVVNLRSGFIKEMGDWTVSPFIGLENLLDESYSSNVRINANGGRYFEPAPGLNVYGGIRIAYRL